MGRPRLHDEATERALLTAAERLLVEEGVEAVTVRRTAEAAGVSPRAIYSLFGAKDGVLRALYREAFHALAADVEALPVTDDPVADVVAAGAVAFRGWARARPDLFRLVFLDGPTRLAPKPAESEAGVQALERLMMRIRRCEAEGVIAAGEARAAGMAFHALCEGLAALELRGRFPLWSEQDAVDMWRRALSALLRGFAPTGQA